MSRQFDLAALEFVAQVLKRVKGSSRDFECALKQCEMSQSQTNAFASQRSTHIDIYELTRVIRHMRPARRHVASAVISVAVLRPSASDSVLERFWICAKLAINGFEQDPIQVSVFTNQINPIPASSDDQDMPLRPHIYLCETGEPHDQAPQHPSEKHGQTLDTPLVFVLRKRISDGTLTF